MANSGQSGPYFERAEQPPTLFRRKERPIPRMPGSGSVGVTFNQLEVIRQTEKAALLENDLLPSVAQQWFDRGVNLAWDLWDARKLQEYSDDLGLSVFIIFTKAMNDFLATAHLCRTGYQLPAFATLRGGFEATELLEYLIGHPAEVAAWLNQAKRFDSLGWIRRQLPKPTERENLYAQVNNFLHCNAIETTVFVSRTLADGRKAMLIGPIKLDPGSTTPLDMVSSMISYPVRVLWKHNPGVAPREWVKRFYVLDKALNFPFGEPWTP